MHKASHKCCHKATPIFSVGFFVLLALLMPVAEAVLFVKALNTKEYTRFISALAA